MGMPTGPAAPPIFGKTDFEDGTLTLGYSLGSHLAFMFDARYDTASAAGIAGTMPTAADGVFLKNMNGVSNGQFTTTLGVIASTK